MLILKSIVKEYTAGDRTIKALNNISLEFKENGLVSILGPSGCGKTTLLNIIGGLDEYTGGDLLINGKSTREFSDGDWDTYRNNSMGFVFQSDNLVPHRTILANVELALAIFGVSVSGHRERAIAVLTKVGLKDQLHNKPNQLFNGQLQLAAVARALVKEADILLVDEPTAALDSESCVQIMEILKEIARDKLVIMATNNPELAMEYSARIIKLLDGKAIDDSKPYHVIVEKPPLRKNGDTEKPKKTSINLFSALSLSINNFLAKQAGTLIASFAGSIGTIEIGLIWALSNCVQTSISFALATIPMVVSFILIGIIRYLSVLESAKQIGILRGIGASKQDIFRIFNAESLVIGLVAGAIGISVTLLIITPINMIIKADTGISGFAALSVIKGVILILISITFNFLAGLLPSGIAAKKVPIIVLMK